MKRAILFSLPLLALSAPGWAEQHDHATAAQIEPADPAATTTAAQQEVMDHSAMEHGEMEHGKMDMPVDQEPMDHSQMDHGSVPMPRQEAPMDASKMDHASMVDQSPIPAGPPPPEAFSGPAFAADAFVGADKMAASRASVVREVSGVPVYWFQADRAEYRAREGKDGYLWDVQGYYGGDIDKFWFKSEGEGNFGEKPESAEVQALWSHAIAPRWDIQAGVRQDLTGPERTHAVIGVQGLAPYLFELDAAAFVSNKGDITARIEGLPKQESNDLLQELFRYIHDDEIKFQHRWSAGDLVMMDNRCIAHARLDFPENEERMLRRTMVEGVPIGA